MYLDEIAMRVGTVFASLKVPTKITNFIFRPSPLGFNEAVRLLI